METYREALSLVDQFASKRPGSRLIAVEPAALPVTLLNVTVLAQERKQLPLLEEFILRCSAKGVIRLEAIAELLGIELSMAEECAVGLVARSLAQYHPKRRAVTLTATGQIAARDLAEIVPSERTFKVPFDRTTWAVGNVDRNDLIAKSLARFEGRILLPAAASRRIDEGDVSSTAINRLLAVFGESNVPKVEVLRVARVRPSVHKYLRCWMLVYASGTNQIPEIEIVVDGQISETHGMQIATNGGARSLGMSVAPRPDVGPSDDIPLESAVSDVSLSEIVRSRSVDQTPRKVEMYELLLFLHEALSLSRDRLAVRSSAITSAVLTDSILADLEGALRRKVRVAVDYAKSSENNESRSERSIVRKLDDLRNRYPNHLSISRRSKSQGANFLVVDDFVIQTTFAWLAHRREGQIEYRLDEGTLVGDRSLADDLFERSLANR